MTKLTHKDFKRAIDMAQEGSEKIRKQEDGNRCPECKNYLWYWNGMWECHGCDYKIKSPRL